MVVANTFFKKRYSRLVTYQPGNSSSQFDYVLVAKSNRKMVKDVNVVAREEYAPQYKLRLRSDYQGVRQDLET